MPISKEERELAETTLDFYQKGVIDAAGVAKTMKENTNVGFAITFEMGKRVNDGTMTIEQTQKITEEFRNLQHPDRQQPPEPAPDDSSTVPQVPHGKGHRKDVITL